ncbi:MAG: hypothetical protein KBB36_06395 [Ferrovibrio sp.]|nr:hypothetical protein [Ferrovibrio sp.]
MRGLDPGIPFSQEFKHILQKKRDARFRGHDDFLGDASSAVGLNRTAVVRSSFLFPLIHKGFQHKTLQSVAATKNIISIIAVLAQKRGIAAPRCAVIVGSFKGIFVWGK